MNCSEEEQSGRVVLAHGTQFFPRPFCTRSEEIFEPRTLRSAQDMQEGYGNLTIALRDRGP